MGASKKELEDRIAALEAEIALLRAQLPIAGGTPIWIDPRWYPCPKYPIVWCGTSTVDNTVTINGPLPVMQCLTR